MKKLLGSLFIGLLALGICGTHSCAAEEELTDEWNDIGKMQDAWDDQQVVTDDEFDRIIEQRTRGAREKQEKKLKKKIGEALVPANADMGNLMSIPQVALDYPTLLVPQTLVHNEIEVPVGYYRVIAAKNKKGQMFINFYQGSSLIAKIPAVETEDDFGAETINYAKIIYADNDKRAKVVYGCLEYNLIANLGTK